MTLIKCPQCDSEVSDNAPVCPNCGNPIVKQEPKEVEAQAPVEAAPVEAPVEAAPAETPKEAAPVQSTPEVTSTPVNTAAPKGKTNGLALSGMIVGICSLFIDLFMMTSITGLVLSIIGMVNVKKNNQKGFGFALTGIICAGFEILYKFCVMFF